MSPHTECNFDNKVTDCKYRGSWCPAERAVQLCNAIQVRFMDCSYTEIWEDFEYELYEQLKSEGYEGFIFWTPEGEKSGKGSKTFDLIQKTATPFQRALNEVIIRLNEGLHSHDFLRKLTHLSESAKSRVFSIYSDTDALCFKALYPETRDQSPQENLDLIIRIKYPENVSPEEFRKEVQKNYMHGKPLLETVAAYIKTWAETSSDSEAFRLITENADFPTKDWKKSLKHFGLMALFADLNGFPSISYYLSPLDREKLKSSMVIYWSGREPGRYFHYLLQMLLGLNAAPILYHQEQAYRIGEARKMALGHYGHTLKHRLDTLNAFLDEHGTSAIKMRKDMLRDLTLILQLNTLDNLEELLNRLPFQKQERFLDIEGIQGVEERLDLIKRIKEWSRIVGGRRYFPINDPARGIRGDRLYKAELNIGSEVKTATIGLHLEASTPGGKKRARLKEAIYRELIFELLNNSIRYGAYTTKYDPNVQGGYLVIVWGMITQVHLPLDGIARDLLVISNEIQPGKTMDPFISSARKKR